MEELMETVIKPFKPDIVGLSYATFNVLAVHRLQQLCRAEGYFVIAGGNHPSIKADESLRAGADLVFRGEAELGIDDFCSWFREGRDRSKRSSLRGVSFIDENGSTVDNPKPPRIKDLDDIGDLDFSSLNLDEFTVSDGSTKGLNVISCGRGCPYQCSYCSHSDWYQHGKRSVDSMVQEMVTRNEKYGVNTFWMADETFTVNKDHIYKFCDRIRKEKLPFKWLVGTRATSVDEQLLRAMKDAGMIQVTYGIESADDDTLKRINKGYTSQKAYEAVTMTGKLGIPMYINLMTGFPWETPVHVENNVRFIKAVDPYVYCFQLYGAVIPYPDTPIYEEYHESAGFTNFWLMEKYQNAGMVIYQNVSNPYKVSTYYQRNLYDDTYVAEDYFFPFSRDYKKAVAEMGLLIGKKAIQAQGGSVLKRYGKYVLGGASMMLYGFNPNLEKRIVGSLAVVNRVHENRLTGQFVKK
jgi:radical SAM superfamily enzyme YgiQ (UPF0313 family)